jgi:nickel transport protein
MGRVAALAAALALATSAAAHDVRHELVRGRAVAVRAVYEGGEPLAYAEYQVFAPSDPRVPFQKGRTDRAGWLAFVPSEPGSWRVQVSDATGHGITIDVPSAPAAGAAARTPGEEGRRSLLGTLGGLAAIGGVFTGLFLLARRRRSP